MTARPSELKPCPFCGDSFDQWHAGSDNEYWAGATCKMCGVTLDDEGPGCKDRVIAAWNRRAELDRAQGDAALGELPEPAGVLVIGGQALRGFTADQMRAYALAARGGKV